MRGRGEVNRATECAVSVMGDCYAAIADIFLIEPKDWLARRTRHWVHMPSGKTAKWISSATLSTALREEAPVC